MLCLIRCWFDRMRCLDYRLQIPLPSQIIGNEVKGVRPDGSPMMRICNTICEDFTLTMTEGWWKREGSGEKGGRYGASGQSE